MENLKEFVEGLKGASLEDKARYNIKKKLSRAFSVGLRLIQLDCKKDEADVYRQLIIESGLDFSEKEYVNSEFVQFTVKLDYLYTD